MPLVVNYKISIVFHAAYYNLPRKDREIVDSQSANDGTKINWKMMETVIQYVHNLEHLVELHGAGDYVEGTTAAMMHTLKWTNCGNHNKHMVIITKVFLLDMLLFQIIWRLLDMFCVPTIFV